MKKIILTAFCLLSIAARSQVGVSLYPWNNTIGIRSSMERLFAFELRSGFYLSHTKPSTTYQITPQILFTNRVASAGPVNLRIGLSFGLSFNNPTENSFFMGLPLAINVYPIKDNEHFSITAELGGFSAFYRSQQELSLRGLIGINFFIYNNLKHDPERR